MNILTYILIFTLIGSVISLVGGVLLLLREKFALKISHYLSAFAAGTLLGAAFFDLLPEAFESGGKADIFLWTLGGILIFFLLERFIHHHHQHPKQKKPIVPLIVIGDSIHNFIDGVAIAATFLISVPLGITTSLAVAAHEIPQEIGDFGLMINQGLSRKRVLSINFYTALTAMMGAILTFWAKDQVEQFLPLILSLTAGFFIYIASANLIPEIHNRDNKKIALWETILLLVGVVVIYLTITSLGGRGL